MDLPVLVKLIRIHISMDCPQRRNLDCLQVCPSCIVYWEHPGRAKVKIAEDWYIYVASTALPLVTKSDSSKDFLERGMIIRETRYILLFLHRPWSCHCSSSPNVLALKEKSLIVGRPSSEFCCLTHPRIWGVCRRLYWTLAPPNLLSAYGQCGFEKLAIFAFS